MGPFIKLAAILLIAPILLWAIQCPENWLGPDPHRGYCYGILGGIACEGTWKNLRKKCQSAGADLPVFDTADDWDWFDKYVVTALFYHTSINKDMGFWLGYFVPEGKYASTGFKVKDKDSYELDTVEGDHVSPELSHIAPAAETKGNDHEFNGVTVAVAIVRDVKCPDYSELREKLEGYNRSDCILREYIKRFEYYNRIEIENNPANAICVTKGSKCPPPSFVNTSPPMARIPMMMPTICPGGSSKVYLH